MHRKFATSRWYCAITEIKVGFDFKFSKAPFSGYFTCIFLFGCGTLQGVICAVNPARINVLSNNTN